VLSLNKVSAAYGEVIALHSISLMVQPGEIVTLLGANGAGKSTALRCISGLIHPMRARSSWRVNRSTGSVPRPSCGWALVMCPRAGASSPADCEREPPPGRQYS